MPITDKNTLYEWFKNKKKPVQEQFWSWIDSYWHKEEKIPMSQITNLTETIQGVASAEALTNHINDLNAHAAYLAKRDATNLNTTEVDLWKEKLGVGEIPPNVALVDMGSNQSVWNKSQIEELCMLLGDFVTDGKVRADKIEALGLTEILQQPVQETSIVAFAANSANYEFQKNDIIPIPTTTGDYRLYIFRGGDKTVVGNYFSMGLSTVTIGMVEGLQAALNGKVDHPLAQGSYIYRIQQGIPQWRLINITTNYLPSWNGTDLVTSPIYSDGTKLGIGTTSPSEVLHLNNGRLRSKAVVLDENSEALPNQLTLKARRWYVSDLTGTQSKLMYLDYSDYDTLIRSFTTAQKENLAQAWNNQYSNGLLTVYSITPTVMLNDHTVKYLVLQGLNLNVNTAATSVKFIPVGNAIGVGEIDCLGFQTNADGKSMTVSIYGDSLAPNMQYNIIIRTTLPNAQTHRTTSSINVVTNIGNMDVSTLTWQKKAITPGQEGTIFMTNGGNFAYNANTSNRAFAYEPNTIVGVAKSSLLFGANTNFYLDINISLSIVAGGLDNYYDFFGYIGLMSNNVVLDLIDSTFIRIINSSYKSGGYQAVLMYNDIVSTSTKSEFNGTVINGNLIIMRTGNAYSQFLIIGNTMISQTKISTTDAVSLFLGASNGVTKKSISASIAQAFTF